ncbi:UDP-N-acetylmuramoyl-L-alanyl-D-glutamate--2,6-diaminopimelate ligase [Methylolobus aquaticus]
MALGKGRQSIPLSELLGGLVPASVGGAVEVSGLCLDSRAVRPGDLFVAVAGHQQHGMQFSAEAVRRGARAILYDPAGGGEAYAGALRDVVCVPAEGLLPKVGFIADRFFGHPSSHLDVIAVTGTNGKTSCTHFLANALTNGDPAAVIGTLGWGVPGRLMPTDQTTPDAIGIHAILAELRAREVRAVALEASSHGLAQGRLNGVLAKAALFTNITRDHLDYHGTHEAYVSAKMRLLDFAGLETVAFNADDPVTRHVGERLPSGVVGIPFSVAGSKTAEPTGVVARRIEQRDDGLRLSVEYTGCDAELVVPLFGNYNAENILGVLAVMLGLGFGLTDSVERLGNVRPVPGRMEHFRSAAGANIVVDYAHTPDALERVLLSLRRGCARDLWVVFGCGGERDRGKRPLMGRIAGELADHVVITDDNPRHEDGDAIVADILAGCVGNDVRVQRDRRQAMQIAIEAAAAGDVVLIAGKGHEVVQDVNGTKTPFDDRVVARELLQ